MKNIYDIASKIGIDSKHIIPYGNDMAKINNSINEEVKNKKDGKLVLVTAITPTKVGEGKTTSSICLHDGFHRIGVNSLLCLREPSLGPVFGIKGGATGGGKANVIPSEDINLHFTGDMHALTSSINLISAIIDNHIYQGNLLRIDPDKIVWKRALDMNDRSLRSITVNLNDKKATPHHDEFVITVASELMAIMCLSLDENDFINRINEITVAYDFDDNPIKLKQLSISKAILKLMKKALLPNLVQTEEENPVLIHGGPFANIAHGCNSLIATKLALKLAPITITEAGFGADLGAEKFLDIACRVGSLHPDCVVMVATVRALKMHGGQLFEDLKNENIEALNKGVLNLKKHLDNIALYNIPTVVCINKFIDDTDKEIETLSKWLESNNIQYSLCNGYSQGSEGSIDLAQKVYETLLQKVSKYTPLYELNNSIKTKIATICTKIYGCKSVIYSEKALEQIDRFEQLGYKDSYICIAKTPQSLSDNDKLLGVPTDFDINIREVRLSSGANFIIPLTGKVMTMPGLPKIPAAVKMETK